jgi:hypothetical protein
MGGTMKENSRSPGILRPGAQGWELWKAGATPERLPENAPRPQKLVVAPPTHSLLALPLWVSPHGAPEEIVELEFSSRHLFRRGQALSVIELERSSDRVLVLGVLGSDDPALQEPIKQAQTFEIPARLLPADLADVVFWKEDGRICYAFYRNGQCAYFSTTGEEVLSRELSDAVHRTALRLQAEEILATIPARAMLAGPFQEAEQEILKSRTGWSVEMQEELPPRLPTVPSDVAPPEARLRRDRQRQLKRTGRVAAIVLSVYAGILLIVGINFFAGQTRLNAARREAQALAQPAEEAKDAVERWRLIRPAIDSKLFALDLLAGVAAALPAETVRLTSFTLEGGQLIVAGEAAEVSQTYEMLERLKNSPALSEFEWTAGNPDIASKNNVRFQFQGRSADATTDPN